MQYLTENNSEGNPLVQKWEPILEGIEDAYTRESTAVLLENQARSVLTDIQKEHGESILSETTSVGNLGTFQKFAFPLVRRVFPELIANKIAGVQPMQGPVSQVFYLGSDRVTNPAGGEGNTMYSRWDLTYAGKIAANQGNLGALDVSTDAAGWGGKTLSGLSANAWTDSKDTVGGFISNFPSSVNEDYYGAKFNVSAGEKLSGSAIPQINFHIEQQAVTARTRKFRALWTLEAAQDLRAYHNLDLERELTDLLGKEVALEIDREIIEDIRNLAYDWGAGTGGINFRATLEQPNANNFGSDGVDFTPGAFDYQMRGGPAGPVYGNQANGWDSTGKYLGSNPAGTLQNVFLVDFGTSALGLAPRHVGEVYANLLAAIQFASQDIYKSTLRGAANWIVTSPFIAAILYSASKLEGGAPKEELGTLGANIQYKGKFMGQFDVYVDPLYPDDEIMLGYKGQSPMDAGYCYCPYIPLQMLPTITDPETFQPRKGLLTRYGKVGIGPESRFYRIIRIIGANSNYLLTPFAKASLNSQVAP